MDPFLPLATQDRKNEIYLLPSREEWLLLQRVENLRQKGILKSISDWQKLSEQKFLLSDELVHELRLKGCEVPSDQSFSAWDFSLISKGPWWSELVKGAELARFQVETLYLKEAQEHFLRTWPYTKQLPNEPEPRFQALWRLFFRERIRAKLVK